MKVIELCNKINMNIKGRKTLNTEWFLSLVPFVIDYRTAYESANNDNLYHKRIMRTRHDNNNKSCIFNELDIKE